MSVQELELLLHTDEAAGLILGTVLWTILMFFIKWQAEFIKDLREHLKTLD